MRFVIVVAGLGALLLASLAVSAGAGEVGIHRGRRAVRTDLFIDLPLEYSTEVVFPFGGSHHAVPGVVTINREPYRCLVHERRFRERGHFVAHLRREHGLVDDAIPSAVIVDRGEVVYLGE